MGTIPVLIRVTHAARYPPRHFSHSPSFDKALPPLRIHSFVLRGCHWSPPGPCVPLVRNRRHSCLVMRCFLISRCTRNVIKLLQSPRTPRILGGSVPVVLSSVLFLFLWNSKFSNFFSVPHFLSVICTRCFATHCSHDWQWPPSPWEFWWWWFLCRFLLVPLTS